MKLNKWFYGAAAILMMGACSDNFDGPSMGGGEEEGQGYIGINIQMPTEKGTRGNDTFAEGVAQEYTLGNATLVLFRCDDDTEAKDDIAQNAKCIGAFDLQRSKNSADKDPSGQITTQVTRFAKVTGMAKNDKLKLYALVMANGNNYNLKTSNIENACKGMTIKQVQETVTSEWLYTQETHGRGYASDIFMTNSPLSIYQGGNVSPNATVENIEVLPVLVEINSKTYPSEEEAISNPAGIIHIERAVGKVTCSSFNPNTTVKVNVDGKTYSLIVDEISWDLGQDMQDTYLVRNTNRKPVDKGLAPNDYGKADNMWAWNLAADEASANEKYRMIGSVPITAGTETFYRPYFCQVPGYGVAKDDKQIYEDKIFRDKGYMEANKAVEWDDKSAFYPHENTFPVEFMKYANTTRIGFWVTFKFKEIDKDGKDVLTEDGKQIFLDMKNKSFYVRGLDRSVIYVENPLINLALQNIKNREDVKQAVKDAMITADEGGYSKLNLADIIDVKYEDHRENDGQVSIKSISFKKISEMKDQIAALFNDEIEYTFSTDLVHTLNDLEVVREYKGGKAFYEVRIKHFGEDLTPWDPEKKVQASTINESYGSDPIARKRNYLGRYGIVRNNWYDLNVTIIHRLGPPVDPARWDDSWPGTPDDNKDEYISVILRVLSWAKRTQNVEF